MASLGRSFSKPFLISVVLLSCFLGQWSVHGLYHQYNNYRYSHYPDDQAAYDKRMQQLQAFTKYSPPRTYDGYGYQTRNTYPVTAAGSYGYSSNYGNQGAGATYGEGIAGKIQTLTYNNALRHPANGGYETKTAYAPPKGYDRPYYKSGPGYAGPMMYGPQAPLPPPPPPPPASMNQVMMPVPYPRKDISNLPLVKKFDPCSGLPEGDYALEAEFTNLFPGVDPQCNFIKCANYKAFINPCSIGTKNTLEGKPDPDYGFCAVMDDKKYCGQYPPADGAYPQPATGYPVKK